MKITKVTPWLVSFPWEVRTGVEQKLEIARQATGVRAGGYG